MNPTEALHSWLNESVGHSPAFFDVAEQSAPRKIRLAYLFFCNGASFDVSGWGILGTHPNGHPSGLEQREALELLGYSGVLHGFDMCGVNVQDELTPALIEYHLAWMEKREKRAKLEAGTDAPQNQG